MVPAGDFGNEQLQAEAARLLKAANGSSLAVPPDLAAVVGQLAVQGGDAIAIYAVTKQFQTVRLVWGWHSVHSDVRRTGQAGPWCERRSMLSAAVLHKHSPPLQPVEYSQEHPQAPGHLYPPIRFHTYSCACIE